MANTMSAKKAIRGSLAKKEHNLFWKRRIDSAEKAVKKLISDGAESGILNASLTTLQKIVDKAAKEKVIHKNAANRIKSRMAKKISANATAEPKATKPKAAKPSAKTAKSKS